MKNTKYPVHMSILFKQSLLHVLYLHFPKHSHFHLGYEAVTSMRDHIRPLIFVIINHMFNTVKLKCLIGDYLID
jgi:hypothetical protein